MKKVLSLSLITIVLAVFNTSVQASGSKPYCTAGSTSGAYWWTWTASSKESACYTALLKTFKKGKAINAIYHGYYKTNGLNKGKLFCGEGKKKVIGNGAEIFTNAANMKSQLGWKKHCVVIVK